MHVKQTSNLKPQSLFPSADRTAVPVTRAEMTERAATISDKGELAARRSHDLPIAMLGVRFDHVTTQQAIQAIERMIASRRPHYVVTANVDFLVQAQEDVELRRILFYADLVLCDGTPLVWMSRLLGNALPERVAGADLAPVLIEVAAARGYRLFFLGATPESLEHAIENLKRCHSNLTIAGHYSPPFNRLLEMDHPEIKRRILEARPDILFVSFGCPKQEKWIAMHYRSLGVPVAIGVGATIDFLAGEVRRAPVWMQRIGAEWLFRLAQEPRRLFRRYFKDLFIFGWKMMLQTSRLGLRRQSPNARATESVAVEADWQQLQLPERIDLEAVRNGGLLGDALAEGGRNCFLEASEVKFIDSTGVGQLMRIQKRLREKGLDLVLIGPSHPLRRALGLMRLEEFFLSASDIKTAQSLVSARARERLANVRASASSCLSWQGEITAANAEAVWERTQVHCSATAEGQEWIIDLSDVRFIDSSGLGVMVRAKKLAGQQGRRLRFVGLQPAVRNVIHIARLETFLLGPAAG